MPQQPSKPQRKYLDRPEISETFADGLESCLFAENVARITFTASRWRQGKAGSQPVADAVTAVRLVLTAQATASLYYQLSQMMKMLAHAGLAPSENKPPEGLNK
jgi:hypothetical protein